MEKLKRVTGDSPIHIKSVSGDAPQVLRTIASGGGFGKALATTHTTAEWSALTSYIPKKGEICVWSDYRVEDGVKYAGIKVGDGMAYAVDLPFVGGEFDDLLTDHISNNVVHITAAERLFWNNKVSAEYGNETLILSKD